MLHPIRGMYSLQPSDLRPSNTPLKLTISRNCTQCHRYFAKPTPKAKHHPLFMYEESEVLVIIPAAAEKAEGLIRLCY